jgi:hypothetical protein
MWRGLAVVVGIAAYVAPLGAQAGFPHTAHEGLFPVCAGCHPAAAYGDAERLYPAASSCGNCHDGVRVGVVRWAPPGPKATTFRHVAHRVATRDAGAALECGDCHVAAGGGRMAVGPLNVGTACVGCHRAHEPDATCALCHAPAPADQPLSVHAGCDDCHRDVRVDALPRTRNFCLLCHAALKSHEAPRECVECHLSGVRRAPPRAAAR